MNNITYMINSHDLDNMGEESSKNPGVTVSIHISVYHWY